MPTAWCGRPVLWRVRDRPPADAGDIRPGRGLLSDPSAAGPYWVAARFRAAALVRHCINDSTCIFPVATFIVATPQICLVLTQSYF